MTPERHSQSDEAARYVLGQLPPAARHEFEVQLAQSPELRALVQELEEGVEAAARAVPQRPPPPQAWTPIERAIALEAQRKVVTPPVWSYWWRSGWAAAAACLLAFLGYAWWPLRKETPPVEAPAATVTPVDMATISLPIELTPTKPAPPGPDVGTLTNTVVAPVFKPPAEAANPELASLRWQVAALQAQLEQLSGIVLQQKAIMSEAGRFKFFPLTNGGPTATGNEATAPLSAGLQRAIFYAMARDMGWLPGLAQRESPTSPPAAGTREYAGIDFVDLNTTQDNSTSAANTGLRTSEGGADKVNTEPVSVGSSGTIPGFVAGTNLVMAFDQSMISRDSAVAFWTASALYGHQLVGSAVLGENPMVVTLPAEQVRNGNLIVTANTASGPSNVIGHFFILRYSHPEGHPQQSQ